MPSEARCDEWVSTARAAYTPTRNQVVGLGFVLDGTPDAKTTTKSRGIHYLFLFVVVELGNNWIGTFLRSVAAVWGQNDSPRTARTRPEESF